MEQQGPARAEEHACCWLAPQKAGGNKLRCRPAPVCRPGRCAAGPPAAMLHLACRAVGREAAGDEAGHAGASSRAGQGASWQAADHRSHLTMLPPPVWHPLQLLSNTLAGSSAWAAGAASTRAAAARRHSHGATAAARCWLALAATDVCRSTPYAATRATDRLPPGRDVRQRGCDTPVLAASICEASNAMPLSARQYGTENRDCHECSGRESAGGGSGDGGGDEGAQRSALVVRM